ncbi:MULTISPECIES: bacteriocin fulvocin C-related protein [Streptomyces]|uniref:bacteriocin fulvocin C-related protein n=1 Tax=Streptomyces TaxID=1883 RepID=UPI00374E06E1
MASESRWVLGFDASCSRCRAITQAVENAVGDGLETLPLANADVRRWRDESLGPDAPWLPTLIRIDDGRVRAWTGPAMGLRLLTRLGPAGAFKLFRTLGDLSHSDRRQEPGQNLTDRRRFLRFGAGLGIAAGIVLTGRAPALADEAGRAHAWVAANKDGLPKTYAEFSEHSVSYRRAIYSELGPSDRSRLWAEHVTQYRRAHLELSPRQQQLLDALETHIRDEFTFRTQPGRAPSKDERLEAEIIDAFGREEATLLVATLGPAPVHSSAAQAYDCECNTVSDYCIGVSFCYRDGCTNLSDGCGWLYNYPCNGRCWI